MTELSVSEKIDWLIENEGCELADGYSGLDSYLKYCCSGEVENQILELIKPLVDEQYEIVKEEYDYEQEMETNFGAETAADLIWSDLCGRKGFHLAGVDEDIQKEIKESWTRLIRNHA